MEISSLNDMTVELGKDPHLETLGERSGDAFSFSLVQIPKIVDEILKKSQNSSEVLVHLNRILENVEFHDLESAISGSYEGFSSLVDKFHELLVLTEGKICDLKNPQKSLPLNLPISFLHGFQVSLESFLQSIGLLTYFQPAVCHQEIEEKNQQMNALLSFAAVVSSTFMPMFGRFYGALSVGAIATGLLLAAILYPFWKPIPLRLPKFQNLSLQDDLSLLPLGPKRQKIIDWMANAIAMQKNDRRQILLVGAPGSGKTSLVYALADQIRRGKYPELEDHLVYYTNTADLLIHIDWVKPPKTGLGKILEMVQGYNDRMIFIFDQIHLLSFFHGKTFMGDQFTAMLDFPEKNFSHVIGIVNQFEYGELKERYPSFLDRFVKIDIPILEEEDVIMGLQNVYMNSSVKALLSEDILEYIVQQAFIKETDRLKASNLAYRILNECLSLCSKRQKTPLEVEAEDLENQLDHLQRNAQINYNFGGNSDITRVIFNLKLLLCKKKSALEAQKEHLESLCKDVDLLFDLKKAVTEHLFKNQKIENKRDLAALLLIGYCIAPTLEEILKEQFSSLGLKIQVDKDLVDSIVSKM